MNENQRKLRRTAAIEFMQSLEQLEVMLKSDPSIEESQGDGSQTAAPDFSSPQSEETGLDSLVSDETLDQVAADIDRYIEVNNSAALKSTD